MPGAAVPRFELKLTKMWAAFSATVGTSSEEAELVLYTARQATPDKPQKIRRHFHRHFRRHFPAEIFCGI